MPLFAGCSCFLPLNAYHKNAKNCFSWAWETYVIFLPLQFLLEVKLLSLQLHHPLPQLCGLLSARAYNTSMSSTKITNTEKVERRNFPLNSSKNDGLHLYTAFLLLQGLKALYSESLTCTHLYSSGRIGLMFGEPHVTTFEFICVWLNK